MSDNITVLGHFDQINAALVSISDLKKQKHLNDLKLLNSIV